MHHNRTIGKDIQNSFTHVLVGGDEGADHGGVLGHQSSHLRDAKKVPLPPLSREVIV